MARDSKIEWTTHTFNPWWGCVKVSPACRSCYAESLAKRYGHDVWGVGADRRHLSDGNWNRVAALAGERHRVFCASMADVFEDRRDLDRSRERLWSLIAGTPNLDWLLLTKRPEIARHLVPWTDAWPANVWIGTTVEDQKRADERLPELATIPAVVRFISAEPLLGPVSLGRWMESVDWVITGRETGPRARVSSPSWFATLRDECIAADTPFHFKQWGDWAPANGNYPGQRLTAAAPDGTLMRRIGKKQAGRELDDQHWDGLPTARATGKRSEQVKCHIPHA